MEHMSYTEIDHEKMPPTGASLQVVVVGLRGPNAGSHWWAGVSGLAKDLRQLPFDERLRLGYVSENIRNADQEQCIITSVEQYWIELSMVYDTVSYKRRFANIHQLTSFLKEHPRLARALEYQP